MIAHQRTPYQSLLLEHIEKILDIQALANDKYLMSQVDESGYISIESFRFQKDLVGLRASATNVAYAINSSLWLHEYISLEPFPRLKLPYDVFTKKLLLYDLPKKVFQKEIATLAKRVIGSTNNFVIQRHKEGLLMIFNDKESLICFWRCLEYCQINGNAIKAMVVIKKTPKQYSHMRRSQSAVFGSKPKIKTSVPRPEKLPALKVVKMNDNNFPKLK